MERNGIEPEELFEVINRRLCPTNEFNRAVAEAGQDPKELTKLSIAKWEFLDDWEDLILDNGSRTSALCTVHNPEMGSPYCDGCPVYKFTGRRLCRKTPCLDYAHSRRGSHSAAGRMVELLEKVLKALKEGNKMTEDAIEPDKLFIVVNRELRPTGRLHEAVIDASEEQLVRLSMAKWKFLANREGFVFNSGGRTCALCMVHNQGGPPFCRNCPIALYTGHESCRETPYIDYVRKQDQSAANREVEFLGRVLEALIGDRLEQVG